MHSGTSDNQRMFDHHFGVEQRWSPLNRDLVRYSKSELPSKKTSNPRHPVKYHGREVILPLNRMPSDRKPDSTEGESFDWGPFDVPDSEMGGAQITDWAVKQLQTHSTTNSEQPFFMGVGYYRPHIPLFAPSRYFERFKEEPAELPAINKHDFDDLSETAKAWATEAVTAGRHDTVLKHGQWQSAVEAYLACTTFVDTHIGQLIDALDAGQFGDNTNHRAVERPRLASWREATLGQVDGLGAINSCATGDRSTETPDESVCSCRQSLQRIRQSYRPVPNPGCVVQVEHSRRTRW